MPAPFHQLVAPTHDKAPSNRGAAARVAPIDPGSLRRREVLPELMDDPMLDPESLGCALAGLRRLNAVSLADGHLWRAISVEAHRSPRTIRVLDVACAGADWVLRSAARAARQSVRATFSGCDINPRSIDLARGRAAASGLECSFFVHDAVRGGSLGEYDVVTASLFLHHLADDDARRALAKMAEAARLAVIVNDLVRSRRNLWMVGAASRALTRSPVVHIDAARSVRAAFTRAELCALAERAGLRGATIGPGGIGRMSLVYRKDP